MRVFPAVVLVAILMGSGCVGTVGVGPATSTERPTSTTARAPTQPTSATVQTTQYPLPADATSTDAISFETLNDRQRSAFLEALNGSVRFVPNTTYTDLGSAYDYRLVDPFHEHEYVRYDGRYYEIRRESGRYYVSWRLGMEPGAPGPNATVVSFQELPHNLTDEVRHAIRHGHYTVPYGKWGTSIPGALRGTEYIRYHNATYRVSLVMGHREASIVTAVKANQNHTTALAD